jgi:hypothetical protein
MKNKWIISAVVYLVIVTAGYYIVSYIVGGESHQQNESSHHQPENEHAGHGDGANEINEEESEAVEDHRDHGNHSDKGVSIGKSEVLPSIHYDGQIMHISFKDVSGNPVTEFEITHEKLVHLIIISEDLEDYRHVHPRRLDDGTFEYSLGLPEGKYKAFADILPVGYNYHVEPIPITVGKPDIASYKKLVPDTFLSKQLNGITVDLDISAQSTDAPIVLTYLIDGAEPEPYLGALGHVVILDQAMNNFIHVHPVSTTDTVFETRFTDPGIYKIWGEFQLNGEVFFFPFVIEIE